MNETNLKIFVIFKMNSRGNIFLLILSIGTTAKMVEAYAKVRTQRENALKMKMKKQFPSKFD